MERLTREDGLCGKIMTFFCDKQKDCYTCEYGRKCFKLLAAYEDTGLKPEECKAYIDTIGKLDDVQHKEPILVVIRDGCPKVCSLDTTYEIYIIDQRGSTRQDQPTLYKASVISKDARLLREAMKG